MSAERIGGVQFPYETRLSHATAWTKAAPSLPASSLDGQGRAVEDRITLSEAAVQLEPPTQMAPPMARRPPIDRALYEEYQSARQNVREESERRHETFVKKAGLYDTYMPEDPFGDEPIRDLRDRPLPNSDQIKSYLRLHRAEWEAAMRSPTFPSFEEWCAARAPA